MKITRDQVRYVAELARLELDAHSTDVFARQIGTILAYVESLNRVDTQGVPPTSHAISLTNAFREDVVQDSLERASTLANAPQQEEGHFVVPKVIT